MCFSHQRGKRPRFRVFLLVFFWFFSVVLCVCVCFVLDRVQSDRPAHLGLQVMLACVAVCSRPKTLGERISSRLVGFSIGDSQLFRLSPFVFIFLLVFPACVHARFYIGIAAVCPRDEQHCREGEIWAVLDKTWWERWQLYAGCSEDVADAAIVTAADADASAKSVVGHVERDAPTGAAAGSTGAAAEDTAGDVAVTPAAAAETSGTPGDGGDSATAEDRPTAVPPCVSVNGGGGDGGRRGDGPEAQTSGDLEEGVIIQRLMIFSVYLYVEVVLALRGRVCPVFVTAGRAPMDALE